MADNKRFFRGASLLVGYPGIGEFVKTNRNKMGLSQQEVADRVGITQNAYHRIEASKAVKIHPDILEKIFNVLGVKPEQLDWFMAGKGLSHLPQYLIEFVYNPECLDYLEEAFLKWRTDLLRKKRESSLKNEQTGKEERGDQGTTDG